MASALSVLPILFGALSVGCRRSRSLVAFAASRAVDFRTEHDSRKKLERSIQQQKSASREKINFVPLLKIKQHTIETSPRYLTSCEAFKRNEPFDIRKNRTENPPEKHLQLFLVVLLSNTGTKGECTQKGSCCKSPVVCYVWHAATVNECYGNECS